MLAELDVHALHADGAARVNNHVAHLPDAGHHAHRLIALRQHIVLAGPGELPVEQDRQADVGELLQARRSVWRIAVDDVRICLLAQRVGRLLQLT